MNSFAKFFLSMFGVGYFKYAPGSVASLTTCVIFYLLIVFFDLTSGLKLSNFFLIIFIIMGFIFIYSTILIDKYFSKQDPKEVVIDEFIGQLIPLLFLLFLSTIEIKEVNPFAKFLSESTQKLMIENTPNTNIFQNMTPWIIVSFILFRFFDIKKIYPINLIEKKYKNGLGVMLDDVFAGLYCVIILSILFFLLNVN